MKSAISVKCEDITHDAAEEDDPVEKLEEHKGKRFRKREDRS